MATLLNQGTVVYTPAAGAQTTLISNTTVTSYDLSYALSVRSGASPANYLTGDTIRRAAEINNLGSGTLADLTLVSDLAAGALVYVYDSAYAFLDDGTTLLPATFTATPGENEVTFAFDAPLAGGERILLFYDVTVSAIAGASITASDTATAFEGTPSGAAISDSDSVTLTRTVLSITKSAPESANVGDTIAYVFTLTNNSDAAVTVDSLSDQLPTNFTFTALTMNVNGTPVPLEENVDFVIGEDGLLTIAPTTAVEIPAAGVAIVEITGVVTA